MPNYCLRVYRLLLVLVAMLSLVAAEEGAHIDLSVDQSQGLTVGDEVVVSIHGQWPVTATVVEPLAIEEVFADTWVREIGPLEIWQDAQQQHSRQRLRVVAERSGLWTLPQPQVRLQLADGTQQLLRAPAVQLTVAVGEEPELPEGPSFWQSQVAAPGNAVVIVIAGGALVLILSALIVGFWLHRRGGAALPSAAERFAQDCARLELERESKVCAALLSQALRRYIGRHLQIDALAATTADCRRLFTQRLDPKQQSSLLSILEAVDDLRWGPQPPSAGQLQPLIASARQWVSAYEEAMQAAREQAQQAAQRQSTEAT